MSRLKRPINTSQRNVINVKAVSLKSNKMSRVFPPRIEHKKAKQIPSKRNANYQVEQSLLF